MEVKRVVCEVEITVLNTIMMKSLESRPICGICGGENGKENGLSPSISVFP
jgi:hypothetical protein